MEDQLITLHRIVDCSSNVAHLHKFRIKMLRMMRTHLNVFPPQISAREVRSQLLLRRIPCQIVKGWSLTTYDNHDRGKVLLQGEHLLNIENISHIPARVHHILSHTLTAEDTLNALYALPPTYPYIYDRLPSHQPSVCGVFNPIPLQPPHLPPVHPLLPALFS